MFNTTVTAKTFRLIAAACTLAASLTLVATHPVSATEECVGDTNGGESGDCVHMDVFTATDGSIVVEYGGNQDFDHYHLRWSRPGRSSGQIELDGGARGGQWSLENPRTNTLYTFGLQACYSPLIGPDDCTPWKVMTHTKRSKPAKAQHPATCASGFVWREAFPGDLVCVEPWVRDQAAEDNRLAHTRIDPNAGFGPNGCKSGFVWRVARPEDLVCVTTETRAQTAFDNSQAAARLASANP